jgi:hypothetical protein
MLVHIELGERKSIKVSPSKIHRVLLSKQSSKIMDGILKLKPKQIPIVLVRAGEPETFLHPLGITMEFLEKHGEADVDIPPEVYAEHLKNLRLREKRIRNRIKSLDNAIVKVNRRFRHEKTMCQSAKRRVQSDIISYRDDSPLLWFMAILQAKIDFLHFYDDPGKWRNEDYITAHAFLLNDRYTVPYGDKKEATLGDILDSCIAISKSKGANVGDASVENLRQMVASATEDQELIRRYKR